MKLLKILFALTLEIINWIYPLALASVAGLLEAWLLLSIFPAMDTLVLVAILPVIYLLWLLIFICLSAFGTILLFAFVEKPRFLELDIIDDWLLLIKFSPTIISYKTGFFILGFPVFNYIQFSPIALNWLRNLAIRAYSPKVHIGKRSIVIARLQDPDITYIGDNVVIGSGCDIVAHALNTSDGKVKYISEPIIIGNKTTIGGNSRIGMGVKIGKRSGGIRKSRKNSNQNLIL